MEGMDGWLMLRVPTRYRMPARALVQEIAPDKLYDAEIKRHRQKRSLDADVHKRQAAEIIQRHVEVVG